MPPLLDKAGLIDDQHCICIAQVLCHVVTQNVPRQICIPMRTLEQVLHAVGRGITDELCQLPAVLALDVAQQPLQIAQHAGPGLGPLEQRRQAAVNAEQFL